MKNLLWLVLLLIVTALLAQMRWRRDLRECQANLKTLATALEMYASSAPGRYPPNMQLLLVGHYLKEMPTCPSAGRDTYSATYHCTTTPDTFSFGCGGCYHGQRNSPWYDSEAGLVHHLPGR